MRLATAARQREPHSCSRSPRRWFQQAYVKAPNTDAGDRFGTSTALSADGRLAVGAAAEAGGATGIGGDPSDNPATLSGAVYVYDPSP